MAQSGWLALREEQEKETSGPELMLFKLYVDVQWWSGVGRAVLLLAVEMARCPFSGRMVTDDFTKLSSLGLEFSMASDGLQLNN